jgi:hypothetical protein
VVEVDADRHAGPRAKLPEQRGQLLDELPERRIVLDGGHDLPQAAQPLRAQVILDPGEGRAELPHALDDGFQLPGPPRHLVKGRVELGHVRAALQRLDAGQQVFETAGEVGVGQQIGDHVLPVADDGRLAAEVIQGAAGRLPTALVGHEGREQPIHAEVARALIPQPVSALRRLSFGPEKVERRPGDLLHGAILCDK